MSELERVHVRVIGRVQGVYFRASTQAQARTLGLTGWVRNTEDGAVEIEVRGASAAVAALLDWCRRGPPMARVDDVRISNLDPGDADDHDFRVIR
jgi:acylphosphatase